MSCWSVCHVVLHFYWLVRWHRLQHKSHCAVVIPNIWHCQNFIPGCLWFQDHEHSCPQICLTVRRKTTIFWPRILSHFFSHNDTFYLYLGRKFQCVTGLKEEKWTALTTFLNGQQIFNLLQLVKGWTYTPNVAQHTKRKLQTVATWLNEQQQIWMVCLNVIDKSFVQLPSKFGLPLPNALDRWTRKKSKGFRKQPTLGTRLVVCLFGRKSVWVCWQGKREQSSKPSNGGQAAPESQMNQ